MQKVLLLLTLMTACSTPPQKRPEVEADRTRLQDQFIRANKMELQKESDEMDVYTRMHHIPFKTTASGIRYYVSTPSAKGDSIRPGMRITMAYTVALLDGTVCYSSDQDGLRTFEVGHEDIESGIHRGVQYLKRGDEAYLMMPSHLAHGLLGDLEKIPPQSPILYKVRIY